MAQNYVMIDNKRIDLSNETTDNLKKALNITEPKVSVLYFRATKLRNVGYPYFLGSTQHAGFNPEPKRSYSNQDAYIHCYSGTEVKQIIAGLQDLLKS